MAFGALLTNLLLLDKSSNFAVLNRNINNKKSRKVMNLQEKILSALTEINAQYNLPKDQLQKVVGLVPSDLAEDKISSWVESQKPYLALMQSYADSRVTAQTKALDDLKKEFDDFKEAHKDKPPVPPKDGDLESRIATLRSEFEQTLSEKLKGYSDLQQKYEDLQKKQDDELKNQKEREFTELKKRVASELNLSDKALGLLESKLTVDMDEAAVNRVLSEGVKTLNELGIQTIETGRVSVSDSEAAKARAKAYLDRLAEEQNKQ